MKYEIQTKDGYVSGIVHNGDKRDIYDQNFITNTFYKNGHLINCYKLINGEYILDTEKETKELEQYNKEKRLSTLHSYLNETDYITARAFEEVMTLNNPLTFITDMIAILIKYTTQYKDVIAQRKVVRAEIEELEKE